MVKSNYRAFLTKKELSNRIGRLGLLPVSRIGWVISAIFGEIADELVRGNRVKLVGLGRFEVKDMKAHNSINPRTLEKIFVPARRRIKFLASPSMRARLNKKGS
jgi:DNA-binding protein HU-beta